MDESALKVWRGTLLFITAAECCIQTIAFYWQAAYRPETVVSLYGRIALSLPATVLLAAITLTSLWMFLGPRASLVAGYIAALGMKVAGETFESVYTVHHQDFYQGGAMLLGAVIGETYARLVGVSPDHSRAQAIEAQRFGMTGTLAMLAGSYMAAGSSKVITGGFDWASSSAIRLMVLSHTEFEGNPWWLAVPRWTAESPYLCMFLEIGTLIIQLGGFMLIVGPRARRLWATLIVAFHLGIYVTSGILFASPLLFAAAVAIPWARLRPHAPDPDDPGDAVQEQQRPATRPAALVTCTVGVMLLFRLISRW